MLIGLFGVTGIRIEEDGSVVSYIDGKRKLLESMIVQVRKVYFSGTNVTRRSFNGISNRIEPINN